MAVFGKLTEMDIKDLDKILNGIILDNPSTVTLPHTIDTYPFDGWSIKSQSNNQWDWTVIPSTTNLDKTSIDETTWKWLDDFYRDAALDSNESADLVKIKQELTSEKFKQLIGFLQEFKRLHEEYPTLFEALKEWMTIYSLITGNQNLMSIFNIQEKNDPNS